MKIRRGFMRKGVEEIHGREKIRMQLKVNNKKRLKREQVRKRIRKLQYFSKYCLVHNKSK